MLRPTERLRSNGPGIEVVRRLHQSQHRVFQETADGGLQEDARGDVVAVENADKLPLSQGQRMVKVPALACLLSLRVI
ncbi:Uncharacterised protein [Klebsiella pneumoniae]|uniref:Uncharacterized protein n=1 Tax=Klebsiella pneumoniae TaxID=573 RepID=A0A2X3C443_KLEPN|nr:Uncharacterised protein [Klebsiella pneumoniae]